MNKKQWEEIEMKKVRDKNNYKALQEIYHGENGHIRIASILSNALRGKLQIKCAKMSIIECPMGTVNITTRDEDRKILKVKMEMPDINNDNIVNNLNKVITETVDKLYKMRQKVVKKTKQLIILKSIEAAFAPDKSYLAVWEEVLVKRLG